MRSMVAIKAACLMERGENKYLWIIRGNKYTSEILSFVGIYTKGQN
jgi:hypothetical protein